MGFQWVRVVGHVLTAFCVLAAPAGVRAQDYSQTPAERSTVLPVSLGQGQVLRLHGQASNIMIADPGIMDVQVLPHDMLFVFGKKAGRTTMIVLDRDGRQIMARPILVSPDMGTMDRAVSDAQGSGVQLQSSPGGLVLSGQVQDAKGAAYLAEMAQQYAGKGRVLNRLSIVEPVQVSLRVRVAEVQRSVSQELGFDWSTVFNNVGSFALGAATGGLSGAPSFISNVASSFNGVSGSYTNAHGSVTGTLDAMASEGLATVLAEPNLTTMSGEKATFLSGGQFPVPIPQGFGTVGISYQNYGVSIAFTPTVLSDGVISMHVAPEVSSITTDAANGAYSFPGSNGSTVPAIETNKAETTIQLASGQSFAIGGLISNKMQNAISKVPGLGDVPVLGSLFRSTSFQHNESELIIIVTAYIVHPGDRVPDLPTDFVRPTTALESLLLNRTAVVGHPPVDPERQPHLVGAGGFMYP